MSIPALRPEPATVVVPSRLFGPLEVSSDTFILMAEGLLGFAGERRFLLLPAASRGVYWLQSVDQGSLAFLLVDPFLAFPGFEVDVPEHAPDSPPPLVLAIVTLGQGKEPCTANLQAPLLLDLVHRTGRQVVLPDNGRTVREPFDLCACLGEEVLG